MIGGEHCSKKKRWTIRSLIAFSTSWSTSTFNWKAVKNDLEKKGVRVLSAGADEVPGVYKDIREVMKQQADLVEIVARFDPKIVKMCDDGSKAED